MQRNYASYFIALHIRKENNPLITDYVLNLYLNCKIYLLTTGITFDSADLQMIH